MPKEKESMVLIMIPKSRLERVTKGSQYVRHLSYFWAEFPELPLQVEHVQKDRFGVTNTLGSGDFGLIVRDVVKEGLDHV